MPLTDRAWSMIGSASAKCLPRGFGAGPSLLLAAEQPGPPHRGCHRGHDDQQGHCCECGPRAPYERDPQQPAAQNEPRGREDGEPVPSVQPPHPRWRRAVAGLRRHERVLGGVHRGVPRTLLRTGEGAAVCRRWPLRRGACGVRATLVLPGLGGGVALAGADGPLPATEVRAFCMSWLSGGSGAPACEKPAC